ncbi:hypothetical protein AMTR_s02744p00002070 [Amborella trichopoda]|uniref:RRM domain-containing protein n=1 Tax=Amborella trichopoda TaxID=13333 RepID=U5CYA6_AMBTC|nr:hypothetical protein AMTR_s02744p00002070 [Amborella trichopoda]
MTKLTDTELRDFHHLDIKLYRRLVLEIGIDRAPAREVLAFWLWLETVGNPNVIARIAMMSNYAVAMVVEEAQECLAYLQSGVDPTMSGGSDLVPITSRLLAWPISFCDFSKSVASGIIEVLTEVCEKVFDDLCLLPDNEEVFSGMVGFFPVSVSDNSRASLSSGREALRASMSGYVEPSSSVSMSCIPGVNVNSSPSKEGLNPYAFSFHPSSGLLNPKARPFLDSNFGVSPNPMVSAMKIPSIQGPLNPNARPFAISNIYEGQLNPPLRDFGMQTFIMGSLNPDISGIQMDCNEGEPSRRLDLPSSDDFNQAIREESEPLSFNQAIREEIEPLRPALPSVDVIDRGIAKAIEHYSEGRILFLTFSRGHPIDDQEVVDYFNRHYGDVVEALLMQNTRGRTNPLFARLVLRSREMVDLILKGNEMVKHRIRGRDMWARPFTLEKPERPTKRKI